MAVSALLFRSQLSSRTPFLFYLHKHLQFPVPPSSSSPLTYSSSLLFNKTFLNFSKSLRTKAINHDNNPTPPRNTKVNFSLSDSEYDDADYDNGNIRENSNGITTKVTTKLTPPYDPFNKKPVIEEPEDPKNLQEIFHNMRTEGGLFDHAVKMFDALSKDGRTHEALELFGQIKDKGHMPDVVAYTAIIEAYANAGGGQSKEALKVFLRMLASGVQPNAYTYAVLIKCLAGDRKLMEAKKYVMEMMGKGIEPNAGTYTPVFEAFVAEGKEEEAREFLEEMKSRGFVPDEKKVGEVLSCKRGPAFRSMMSILFNK